MGSYEEEASGIRIFPGCWRPHYPFEHIAWISPPWPTQDYVWYDLPEALFSDKGLLYLSHVNPAFPVLFPDLPKMPWREIGNAVCYSRTLPNRVSFGAKIWKSSEDRVGVEIWIKNDSDAALQDIKLQTCLFLRAIREFSSYTAGNKFVHISGKGWLSYPEALREKTREAAYRLGWRGGPAIADLPIIVTVSSEAERLVASTWFSDTYSLVTNPQHPCMHADPSIDRVEVGEKASIKGEIWFFDGGLEDFTEASESWLSQAPRTAE